MSVSLAMLQVRLSYAGKELPPSADGSLLALKPGIDVVAALQPFQGGGEANANAADAAAAAGAGTLAHAAAAAAGPKSSRRRSRAAAVEPESTASSGSEQAAVAKPESMAVWAATSALPPDRSRQSVKQVPGSRQGCSAAWAELLPGSSGSAVTVDVQLVSIFVEQHPHGQSHGIVGTVQRLSKIIPGSGELAADGCGQYR
jgi:hypothetical protein